MMGFAGGLASFGAQSNQSIGVGMMGFTGGLVSNGMMSNPSLGGGMMSSGGSGSYAGGSSTGYGLLGSAMMAAFGLDPMASLFDDMPLMSGVGISIANGQVTGMQELFGTAMYTMGLPSNASFSVGANNMVTETLINGGVTTMMDFGVDATAAGGYRLMSENMTFGNPSAISGASYVSGYTFTISNGAVTGMHGVFGTTANSLNINMAIPPTASFVVGANTVTETLIQGNFVETRTFVPSGNSGMYALASDSKTFVQPGTTTTLLSVSPFERDTFTFDASGHVTQVQAVQSNGAAYVVPSNAFTSYSLLAPGFVEKATTLGAYSTYEVFHDGNGDGIYTAVAHGLGTTVDLVGLQHQLSAAIDAHL